MRRGIAVERAPRAVIIHELRLLDFSGDHFRLRIACSKGIYIRSLAEDLGSTLACGAHLTALRRVAVGPLRIADAVTLDRLAALAEEQRETWLLAPDALLQSLPPVYLDDAAAQRFMHGNPVMVDGLSGRCRVHAESHLLGPGALDGAGKLQPRRVLGAPQGSD